MIGIVATLKIKEGFGAEFEAVATQLVAEVNTNEDGVIYYDLYKEDATTYVFLEKYRNEEAQKLHVKTDYFRKLGAKMGAFMAEAPKIKVPRTV